MSDEVANEMANEMANEVAYEMANEVANEVANDIKSIVFVPGGRLGNAIFRYMACALLNTLNSSLHYCLLEDFIEPDGSKVNYYPGVDHEGDDVSRSFNFLKDEKKTSAHVVAYNILGYYKHTVDIDALKSNSYINKDNGHGIFIKKTITITDDNFFRFINKNLEYFNIVMNGFFQFGHIYLKHKKEILLYMELNKYKHIIQTDRNEKIAIHDIIIDMILPPCKQYDVVIHIRLGDFNGRPDFIEKQYYLALFETINFTFMNSICIICDTLYTKEDHAFIGACTNWFLERKLDIQLERNDVLLDFNIMKQSKILICSMSTLAWTAAYLSKTIEKCYMPDYTFYTIPHRKQYFFRQPIKNTILYPVKTTSPVMSSIKPCILTLPEYSSRLNKLDNLRINLSSIGLEALVYNGINGKDITLKDTIHSHLKFIEYKNKNTFYTYNSTIRINGEGMSKGELGCALSHINLLKQLTTEPPEINYYIIMEDDVELIKPIEELYELLHHLPLDFDLCHLAKSDWNPFIRTNAVNAYFSECSKSYFNRTTAYIISKKGAEKVLLYLDNQVSIPIDDIFNKIYRLTPDFRFYVPFDYFFKEQDSVKSTIKDINSVSSVQTS